MDRLAHHLKLITLAMDSVDDDICAKLEELLINQFKIKEGVAFFEVLIDGARITDEDGIVRPSLETKWPSDDTRQLSIRRGDGSYNGHISYSYSNSAPLWVVPNDHGEYLESCDGRYHEGWSGIDDLPPYVKHSNCPTKTSVIIPMKYDGNVFGVMVIEHCATISYSVKTALVLESIVDSISRIIWLNITTKNRIKSNQKSIQEFVNFHEDKDARSMRPSLFFACSDKAERSVVKVIKDVVLDACNERSIKLETWDDIHASGPITEQIINAIKISKYAVAYLSQPVKAMNMENVYEDNRNVLFECGIFESRRLSDDRDFVGWIPIRECDAVSDAAPFDIIAHRKVDVPRDENGELNGEEFRKALQNQLFELLDSK